MPPSAAVATDHRNKVTWTSKTKENAAPTVEIRTFPVKYEASSNLSIVNVLKTTLTMFAKTDPVVSITSRVDESCKFKKAADFDALSAARLSQLFPGEIIFGRTHVRLFMTSIMPIDSLKRATFGYYAYAQPNIWISEDRFGSTDIRNIGFMMRKDIMRVDRDLYTTLLSEQLSNFTLTDDDAQRLVDAKERMPFATCLPPLQVRLSKNIQINSPTGKVKTSALTIHVDAAHVQFMSPFITRFSEDSDLLEKFVPQTMLHGKDPVHLQAYQNAMVIQNHFLSEIRTLPVIGLHPKAMTQMIQLSPDDPPATMYNQLKRYLYFTSIEPTSSSHTIGKYIFLTTKDDFIQAKKFIIETLPQLWNLLDNTFLDELPASVRCPRLTNSNLRDDSTKRTVALLTMSPEELTVVSQWTKPPTFNQLPKTVSVNYSNSDKNFPALKSKKSNKSARASTKAVPDKTQKSQPLDTASNHSHVTSASVGTALTRDECTSLCTQLTESIVTKMTDHMLDMIKNQSDLAAERERAYAAREAKQDKQFAKMMNTFAQLIPTPPKSTRKQTRRRKKSKSTDPKLDSDMDTSHADAKPPASSRPAQTAPHSPPPAPPTDSTVYDDSPPAQDPCLSDTKSYNSQLQKFSDEASSMHTNEEDSQSFDAESSKNSMKESEPSSSSDSDSSSDASVPESKTSPSELQNSSHRRALSKSPGLDAEVDSETSENFHPSLGLDDRADSMATSVKYRPPHLPHLDSPVDSKSRSRNNRATSDDSATRPPRSIVTPISSNLATLTRRRQPGRGDTTAGRSRGRDSPPRPSPAADHNANDSSSGSVPTILATADNSIASIASTPPMSPADVPKNDQPRPDLSSAIDDAIASEKARHQSLISPSSTAPPSVLRTPKEEPWKVVTSTKSHNRKQSPKLELLSATPRTPVQGGQTPKMFFSSQPATPTEEEMPAQKK
jgi:hypothetical protein